MAFSPTKQGSPINWELMYTFDGEWVTKHVNKKDIYNARLWGLYGGPKRGYRYFTSTEEFLNHVLHTLPNGAMLWGHNVGQADMVFLLPLLRRLLYRKKISGLDPIYSGSRMILLHVQINDRRSISFADTFPTFLAKLADVAVSFTSHKKGECAFDAPIRELAEYNELDCIIPYDALSNIEKLWREAGGALKLTSASSALHLFRSKYLKKKINNHGFINDLIRPWYLGGRTEVFNEFPTTSHVEEFDIKSSYPRSMKEALPGDLKRTYAGREAVEWLKSGKDDRPYFADVTVTVDECAIPPLPMRHKGKLYYPTGTFRGIFARPELELPNVRIQRVHEVYVFEKRDDWAKYIDDSYKIKASSEKGSARYEWAKHRMNDAYGKMAQRTDQRAMVFSVEKGQEFEIVAPGAYLVDVEIKVPHQWVPMAAYITSLSRARWYYGAMAVISAGCGLMYGDTDSLHVDGKLPENHKLDVGGELGQWEAGKEVFPGARYIQPKLYYLLRADPKKKPIVKAKGMRSITREEADAYADGKGITIKRMARIRELIRDGDDTPRELTVEKFAAGPTHPKGLRASMPKRNFKENRPWTIEEIIGKKKTM